MGKVKLTLSVNEEAVAQARDYGKRHGKTLSALFEEKAFELGGGGREDVARLLRKHPELRSLVGAFRPSRPFDERSAHYRRKHG
jgi:hypothetical protein